MQIVHYNRLKPVKEETDQHRVLTRPAPGRRPPAGEADDQEETANPGFFSRNSARRVLPRN